MQAQPPGFINSPDARHLLLRAQPLDGDLLYLAVTADIIWNGPEVESFTGAQGLLCFKVQAMRLVESSLPLRWGESELSPVLDVTGSWA